MMDAGSDEEFDGGTMCGCCGSDSLCGGTPV